MVPMISVTNSVLVPTEIMVACLCHGTTNRNTSGVSLHGHTSVIEFSKLRKNVIYYILKENTGI
jgi:hypothetical protein